MPGGMLSCPVQESKDYFTALFSALPAVNFGTFLAGILISLPVWGFRPMRALRFPTLNVPKPTRVTACPFFIPFLMAANMQEIARSAILLLPTTLATSATKSALFKPLHPLSLELAKMLPYSNAIYKLVKSNYRPPHFFNRSRADAVFTLTQAGKYLIYGQHSHPQTPGKDYPMFKRL